jgi:UDP-glucuronate decarboxylase
MIRLMDTPAEFTGPINIGNPDEFTMLQLAQLVLEKTGSASRIVFKPLPQDDPRQRKPDITLAKRVLDWQPTVKLEEGLIRTIDYFRKVVEDGISSTTTSLHKEHPVTSMRI